MSPVKGNLAILFNNRLCIAECAQMFAHRSSTVLDERDQARAAQYPARVRELERLVSRGACDADAGERTRKS